MNNKERTNTCEFQRDCIEYKDISYLKIMPICAIHELSIACHDKENKCKYYQLYKQLKRKEQECDELKKRLEKFQKDYSKLYQVVENKGYIKELDQIKAENEKLKKQILQKIRECEVKNES